MSRASYDLAHYYQPIVDINNGKIKHYEVLLRGGSRSGPNFNIEEFVKKHEVEKKIFDLDSWNLLELARNLSKNDLTNGIPCAMNISSETILDERFEEVLDKAYSILKGKEDLLQFEITEHVEIREYERINEFAEMVQSMGGEISIDDFGSGHANEKVLNELNADTVKIDGKYVDDILTNPDSKKFIEKAIQIASIKGISVVAEKVENAEQKEALVELGVDMAQGYYYGRPMPFPSPQKAIDYSLQLNNNESSDENEYTLQ